LSLKIPCLPVKGNNYLIIFMKESFDFNLYEKIRIELRGMFHFVMLISSDIKDFVN